MAIKQICLDIDGVLADFVGGTAKLLGFDPAVVDTWDYYPLIGTTEDKFWRAIDAAGADFWYGLTPYPWLYILYKACKKIAPTILLTSPSNHVSSVAGKLSWMHCYFGEKFRAYLMGSAKEFCAGPGMLLIDDSDANCCKFREHGGEAILFPRPWNENRSLSDDPMLYVLDELQRINSSTPNKQLPDTVKEFPTGAVRSRDAETVRYDLVSPIGLRRLAETYAEGAIKYSPHNWLKGFPMSEVLNHAQRHIELWRAGDASEDHLAHAAWNVFALMHFEETRPDLLDIPSRQTLSIPEEQVSEHAVN